MPIERRNPLPKGRYWVDIIDRKGEVLAFEFWLIKNAAKLKLLKREDKGTTTFSTDYSGIRYSFFLFDVLEPVEWPRNKGWGFPSIAQSEFQPTAPKIEKSEDTGVRPKVPGPLESLTEALSDAKTFTLIALAIYAFTQSGRK